MPEYFLSIKLWGKSLYLSSRRLTKLPSKLSIQVLNFKPCCHSYLVTHACITFQQSEFYYRRNQVYSFMRKNVRFTCGATISLFPVYRKSLLVEHGGRTVRIRPLPIGIPFLRFEKMAREAKESSFDQKIKVSQSLAIFIPQGLWMDQSRPLS